MAENNKVIWTEGMFLRQQHFQQQEQYFENYIHNAIDMLNPISWGVASLAIDQQHLALGRLGINHARGLFSDGTPFNTDDGAELDKILELPKDVRNTLVYLALPLRGANLLAVTSSEDNPLARNTIVEQVVKDSLSAQQEGAKIATAKLRLQLLLEKDDRSQYACIPICRVLEVREDNTVVLDQDYIAPCLNCQAIPKLSAYLRELHGMLVSRGEELARRVTNPSVQGSGLMMDFFLLQLINRYELFLGHCSKKKNFLPQTLYEELIKFAGEIATYTHPKKRLDHVPAYHHDNLQKTFGELMIILRQALLTVLDKSVVPLKIQESRQGIKVALLQNERHLLDNSDWIVAVKTNMSVDKLRNSFMAQAKIAPVEKIRDLISSQLPGIKVEPLPIAPPELPYHSGFTYFRLDRTHPLFQYMREKESAGFAFYMSSDLANAELEYWAIKK